MPRRPPPAPSGSHFALVGGVPHYNGRALQRLTGGRWRFGGDAATFNVTIGPDGLLAFRDKRVGWSGGIGFTFDVTDAIMRGLGDDPYAERKRLFAAASRRWRLGLRERHLAKVRGAALRRTRVVWRNCRGYPRASPVARKRLRRLLFSRWDETREGPGGRRMRASILAVLARCLVRYPAVELVALNARRHGKARFAPRAVGPGRASLAPARPPAP